MYTENCDECHTPDAWSPAQLDDQVFSHFNTTGFSLALHPVDYSNQVIICTTCHSATLDTFDPQTCINCHGRNNPIFIKDHQEQFGSECLVCHDGVDRLSNFDHANFFILEGIHLTAQCINCHTDNVYRGTPTECRQCHSEPDIHAGIFGFECNYCHNADAWSPASLLQHIFPLDHGSEEQGIQMKCDVCHESSYVVYTCYNCHEHQADEIISSHRSFGILEKDLSACATCHPIGTENSVENYP
jgi:hypothetical protein